MKNPTLKKVLREILGGRSEPDRYRMLRQYLHDARADMNARTGFAFEDETDAIIADFHAKGVDEVWRARLARELPEWRKRNASKQNRENAIKRWKNNLDQPQKDQNTISHQPSRPKVQSRIKPKPTKTPQRAARIPA